MCYCYSYRCSDKRFNNFLNEINVAKLASSDGHVSETRKYSEITEKSN